MGAKQTKIEGSYLPSTPVAQTAPSQFINMDLSNENNALDPRSPAGCRTPIQLQNKRIGSFAQLAVMDMPERESNTDNALDVLRKRFFKGFTYNLNDPRSPSLNLNRTPLVFEDTLEKSLSLDDTFADLLVEPRLPETFKEEQKPSEDNSSDKCESEVDIEMTEERVILDVEEPKTAPHTPIALQQEFDPRSPSIGVERTPILFTDDEVDDTNEDIMLENILATLSLNLNSSGNSSIVSMPTQNVDVDFNDTNDLQGVNNKPTNKHLDRVRTGNKKSSPKALQPRKPKRRLSRQQIYEDRENHLPTTPKLKLTQIDKNDSLKAKRTPLSCVRNRNGTHTRSRSVESSAKSLKTRLALTSFDDTLNPKDNNKVPSLRIMQQGSQDSLEL